MWIRNKVMKFLGIPGYEIQFYKLLNVNVATLRLQNVFLSYIRITTFLELFQLPSSSPSLFLNAEEFEEFFYRQTIDTWRTSC